MTSRPAWYKDVVIRQATECRPEPINGPESVVKLVRDELENLEVEHCYLILLDNRHRPVDVNLLSIGTFSATLVDPAVVFRRVLTCQRPVRDFVLIHNHPSSDTGPSDEDLSITRRVVMGSDILALRLLDHIIVGRSVAEKPFCSLKADYPGAWGLYGKGRSDGD